MGISWIPFSIANEMWNLLDKEGRRISCSRFWESLMQVMSLSCVIVDLLVKECAWFNSSIAQRHWIVAFRNHVFPAFRNPRPKFIGEGLLLAFRSGSRGSRDGHDFFFAILRAESCLVFDPCLGFGACGGVMRLAAGVLSVLSSFSLFLFSGPVFLRRIFSHVGQAGVGRFPYSS